MRPDEITSLITHQDNYLHCSFELAQVNKSSQLVVFVEIERYQMRFQQDVWYYVYKKDLERLTKTHDHNLIKALNIEDVISLKIFNDPRLSRQKL